MIDFGNMIKLSNFISFKRLKIGLIIFYFNKIL